VVLKIVSFLRNTYLGPVNPLFETGGAAYWPLAITAYAIPVGFLFYLYYREDKMALFCSGGKTPTFFTFSAAVVVVAANAATDSLLPPARLSLQDASGSKIPLFQQNTEDRHVSLSKAGIDLTINIKQAIAELEARQVDPEHLKIQVKLSKNPQDSAGEQAIDNALVKVTI
jgi:hypothetical protein